MYYMDRTTREYPLDRWKVMERNPDISKPINWDDGICAALNVWPVYARAAQTLPRYDETCIETDPIEISGVWYQSWIVVPLTPAELEEKTQQQWNMVIQDQQAILSANVEILPSGNVVPAPFTRYDYALPADLDNIIIQSSNVYVDGQLIPTTTVIVNDAPADIAVDQAITGSNIQVLPGDDGMVIQISSDGNVAEPSGSNLIVVASGNVEVISPYPQIIIIPWEGSEATAEQYQGYVTGVEQVTDQPNPFEIIWPPSPFYADPSTSFDPNAPI